MTSLDKNEENKNINQSMNKTFQRIQKKIIIKIDEKNDK